MVLYSFKGVGLCKVSNFVFYFKQSGMISVPLTLSISPRGKIILDKVKRFLKENVEPREKVSNNA